MTGNLDNALENLDERICMKHKSVVEEAIAKQIRKGQVGLMEFELIKNLGGLRISDTFTRFIDDAHAEYQTKILKGQVTSKDIIKYLNSVSDLTRIDSKIGDVIVKKIKST